MIIVGLLLTAFVTLPIVIALRYVLKGDDDDT